MEKHISWVDAKERELEKKVLAEYSKDEVQKHLHFFTALIRRAGTKEELKAAKYIKGKLEECGVDSEIYEFDAYINHPGEAHLQVLSPAETSLPCLTSIFSTSTPPEGVEAELIALNTGSEEDYRGVDPRGKIGLIKPAGMEGQLEAAKRGEEKGVAAQIHVNTGKTRAISIGQFRNTWGNPTPEAVAHLPKTPAVSVCEEDGEYLSDLTRKGRVLIRLKVDSWRGYKKIRLPIGVLPGSKEPDKYVLAAGHYCSWFTGATDNAAANALMLEMARIFSKYRKNLARGIRFAWWSGHEQGLYAGSTWYLDTFWDDIRDNAIAYLVMDGFGRKGASGFEPRNTEEVRMFQERVIKDVLGVDTPSKRAPRFGDQSYWGMGLPSMTGRPGFAFEKEGAKGSESIWYSHTAEDTLDKVDLDLVSIPFKVNAVSLLRLCNSPVLPLEFVTMAEVIKQALDGLRANGDIPLDLTSLITQAEALQKKAKALNKVIGKNLLGFEKRGRDRERVRKFKEINGCLMGLSRILMPILSSQAGKYGQDPMGGRFQPLPRLQPVKELNSMGRGTEAYQALLTSLVRERNRLSDALNSADRLLSSTLHSTGR